MKGNMSQSRSAEELKNYVPKTRKVNGQTLDNDVQIDNVESAEKLKTARTINGVSFDGTSNIKIYGESELPFRRSTFASKGWYRFAHFSSPALTATILIARGYSMGPPEAYTLILSTAYNSCNFTQIASQINTDTQFVTKIRAIHNKGDTYLEFYYNSEISNYVTAKATNILTSYPTDNFSNVNFEAGSVPEGYAVVEFDLSATPIKTSSLAIGNTTITETQLQALLALLT